MIVYACFGSVFAYRRDLLVCSYCRAFVAFSVYLRPMLLWVWSAWSISNNM